MNERIRAGAGGALALLVAGAPAGAYPGGTPAFQTDAAPFCAGCHSSRNEAMLAGAPPGRAAKELPENKHYALIEQGEGGYGELEEAERTELIRQLRALDAASTVVLEAPAAVAPGQSFEVTLRVTGGAGPVVGLALVDEPHRWRARPVAGVGWRVEGPPRIVGPDGAVQTEWLERRPESEGRNLSFVNVTGIESDASQGRYASAHVVWRLRAPSEPGRYPLAGAYWYGTEKGTPLGYVTDPVRGRQVRGGFTGSSGRILFTPAHVIQVQ
jgi:hypothetical protein